MMKSSTAVSVLLFTLFTLFSAVLALPVPSTLRRDVYVPPVITPDNSTVWHIGQTYDVTWDTTNPPSQITNPHGRIVLGKGALILTSEPGGLDNPLASGFDILSGVQSITVPNVETGDDYFIVLFGDSGNDSQKFTIAPAVESNLSGDSPADSIDNSKPIGAISDFKKMTS